MNTPALGVGACCATMILLVSGCGGTTCVNRTFADCTAADTDCVCFSPE